MNNIVNYQLDDSVATIAMDDGKANVMSLRMLAELNSSLDRAVADKAVVLLTGRPGMFSAGFDLPVLTAGGPDAHAMLKSGFELAARLFAFSTPVVVASTGHTLAMGAFIALAADYRIGADGPFKIGVNEVAIGLTMPYFAIELCKQKLASAYFGRAVLTAEIFAPTQAVAAGFLDQVVSTADLLSTAKTKAASLSKLNMTAYAATKLRVREQTLQTMRKAIEIDDAGFRAR